MKYIIDIPNADVSRWVGVTPHGKKLYVPISVEDGNEYHIGTGVYVEDYTEPDRQAIEDEVWGFAKKVRLEDFIDEEGRLHGYISNFDSYSEAKAKYDAWKANKEQICVGDEVYPVNPKATRLVVKITESGTVYQIDSDGNTWADNVDELVKTGRHFPEVAELLKKMRES